MHRHLHLRNETYAHKGLCLNVYSSFIYNIPKHKQSNCSSMDKHITVYPYNGTSLSNKKPTSDTHIQQLGILNKSTPSPSNRHT